MRFGAGMCARAYACVRGAEGSRGGVGLCMSRRCKLVFLPDLRLMTRRDAHALPVTCPSAPSCPCLPAPPQAPSPTCTPTTSSTATSRPATCCCRAAPRTRGAGPQRSPTLGWRSPWGTAAASCAAPTLAPVGGAGAALRCAVPVLCCAEGREDGLEGGGGTCGCAGEQGALQRRHCSWPLLTLTVMLPQ